MNNPDEQKTHYLKTHPTFFKMLADGSKTFELRENDRDFKQGDILALDEYEPYDQSYTGARINRVITGVMNIHQLLNLFPNADVILSIADPKIAELQRENEQAKQNMWKMVAEDHAKDIVKLTAENTQLNSQLTQAQEQLIALRKAITQAQTIFAPKREIDGEMVPIFYNHDHSKHILEAYSILSKALNATNGQAEAFAKERHCNAVEAFKTVLFRTEKYRNWGHSAEFPLDELVDDYEMALQAMIGGK